MIPMCYSKTDKTFENQASLCQERAECLSSTVAYLTKKFGSPSKIKIMGP